MMWVRVVYVVSVALISGAVVFGIPKVVVQIPAPVILAAKAHAQTVIPQQNADEDSQRIARGAAPHAEQGDGIYVDSALTESAVTDPGIQVGSLRQK